MGLGPAAADKQGGWMSVTLPSGMTLEVNHYCMRQDSRDGKKGKKDEWLGNCLRTWDLQGSQDGRSWSTLMQHRNDQSMPDTTHAVADWPVSAGGGSHRWFRVLQRGVTR